MHQIAKRLAAGMAVALTLCGYALAGDWRLASFADPEGATIGVDIQSIQGPTERRMARVVQVFYVAQGSGPEAYDYIVSDLEMNCAEKTYGFRELAGYNLEGEMVARESSTMTRPIVPESTMAGAEALICRGEWDGIGFEEPLAFVKAVRSNQLEEGPPPNKT